MRRIVRYSVWTLVLLTAAAAAALYLGGGLHWQREAPHAMVASWGAYGTDAGQFNEPLGVTVYGDEVFVSDARNGRIQVFDRHGQFRRSFGEGVLRRPMNLTVAGGRVYVADYMTDTVEAFDVAGNHRRSIVAQSGFDSPGGVAARDDGTLLVADTYGHRVVHVDPDGEVLRQWGTPGEPGRRAAQFRYPTDVVLAADGGFYVADGYNHRVQRFGPDGQYERRWGGPFALGIPGPWPGWFTTATSVAVSADGQRVLVADFFNQRVQVFSADGRFLTRFGRPVEGPLPGPIGVATDPDGNVFVTSFGGHRVERWQPATGRGSE